MPNGGRTSSLDFGNKNLAEILAQKILPKHFGYINFILKLAKTRFAAVFLLTLAYRLPMPIRFSHQTGPRAHQSAGQQLRAHYGLTQEWLAHYLEVPRSTMSMDELNRAHLPTASTLRLLPLIVGLPAPEGPAPEPAATPTAAGQAAAQALGTQRQRECRYEAQRLARQQERLRVRLRQVRLRLQTLPALLASLAPAPADERQRRVLGYWAADAPAQLRDDEAALALLDLRQRVLAFELEELAKLVDEPAGPAE